MPTVLLERYDQLDLPAYCRVAPVQLLTPAELRSLADQAFVEIAARLTQPGSPRAAGAHPHS